MPEKLRNGPYISLIEYRSLPSGTLTLDSGNALGNAQFWPPILLASAPLLSVRVGPLYTHELFHVICIFGGTTFWAILKSTTN